MRLNKTYRPVVLGILLLFAWPLRTAAQPRSPLLDEIVVSVRKANPKWHFVNAVCTCPALVPSQSSYVAGGWYFGKLTSRRHMSIYISYVPTSVAAAEWMAELGRWNVVAGSHRQAVTFADEAYLLTSDNGYAIFTFRNGSVIVEVSGALNDVKFFAPQTYHRRAPDNKSLHASRASGLLIDNLRLSQLRAAA
jgi:hypothetical protein